MDKKIQPFALIFYLFQIKIVKVNPKKYLTAYGKISVCELLRNPNNNKIGCSRLCANFGHLITLMASLFTMILLVMVYFIIPPGSTVISNSRPSVSNIWFQQNEDAWLPNRFQTWSPEDEQDFNKTMVEGAVKGM